MEIFTTIETKITTKTATTRLSSIESQPKKAVVVVVVVVVVSKLGQYKLRYICYCC